MDKTAIGESAIIADGNGCQWQCHGISRLEDHSQVESVNTFGVSIQIFK
jgi:hypothetical protein